MAQTRTHWTNHNSKDFLYRIAFDFITQLDAMMESEGLKPVELAKRLGVSKGRVSQILNNPGNITLKTAVEYARALGVKVALVAYDDDDANNDNGPVNPQVFAKCWEKAGKPTDSFAADAVVVTNQNEVNRKWWHWKVTLRKDDFDLEETPLNVDPLIWQQQNKGLEAHAGTNADQL